MASVTFSDLAFWAQHALRVEVEAAVVERELYMRKLGLARAKADLELAVSRATLEANDAEVLNGKNAEIRKCQLDEYLAQRADLRRRREELQRAEDGLVECEYRLATFRADARHNKMLFDAGLAVARNSEPPTITVISPTPASGAEWRPRETENVLGAEAELRTERTGDTKRAHLQAIEDLCERELRELEAEVLAELKGETQDAEALAQEALRREEEEAKGDSGAGYDGIEGDRTPRVTDDAEVAR